MILEIIALNILAVGIIIVYSTETTKGCLIRGRDTSGDPNRGIDSMATAEKGHEAWLAEKKQSATPSNFMHNPGGDSYTPKQSFKEREALLAQEATNSTEHKSISEPKKLL